MPLANLTERFVQLIARGALVSLDPAFVAQRFILPRVLDFLAKRDLKITWFLVGKDAADPQHAAILRSITDAEEDDVPDPGARPGRENALCQRFRADIWGLF